MRTIQLMLGEVVASVATVAIAALAGGMFAAGAFVVGGVGLVIAGALVVATCTVAEERGGEEARAALSEVHRSMLSRPLPPAPARPWFLMGVQR